jgi:hypothetical protein
MAEAPKPVAKSAPTDRDAILDRLRVRAKALSPETVGALLQSRKAQKTAP